MKRLALPLLALASLAGCVSTGTYKAEQSEAESQKARADGLDAKFSALTSSCAASEQDLSSKLKTTGDSLASAQADDASLTQSLATEKTSNADLQQSLAANKSTLTKKVADLIKDRDALAQKSDDQTAQIADLQKKAADADAARAAAEAAKAAELAKAQKSFEDLQAGLKSEVAAGEIKITQLQGKLTVNLVDRILFDSGKAEIKEDGRKVLDKVGGILNTVQDKNIRIEGHTDDKPIAGELLAKYPSNWELSTARATAVARYLQDHDKVDPAHLVAAGYGEYHPIASNATPEGRALNRRIEIVLVPRD